MNQFDVRNSLHKFTKTACLVGKEIANTKSFSMP